MYIKKGTTRTVLIFPCLGIVIKVAHIRFLVFLRGLPTNIKRYFTSAKWYWQFSADYRGVARWQLFGGIKINWREYQLWRRKRYDLVMPTWFSCGIINIQPFGSENQTDVWCDLYETIGDPIAADDHTFNQKENYVWYGGQLRLVDYGSVSTAKLILRYHPQITKVLRHISSQT